MLLSGLGSAGAWFKAFYYRDEKRLSATLRDRVLEHAKKLRSLNDRAAIEKIESDVDEILRDTLNAYEEGALDEAALSAFGLALDQFRYVATHRKVEVKRRANRTNDTRT